MAIRPYKPSCVNRPPQIVQLGCQPPPRDQPAWAYGDTSLQAVARPSVISVPYRRQSKHVFDVCMGAQDSVGIGAAPPHASCALCCK